MQETTVDAGSIQVPNKIFTDPAWHEMGNENSTGNTHIGLGLHLQMQQNEGRMEATISAIAVQTTSPLQAEAQGVTFAAVILDKLNIQEASLFTDNGILAKTAAVRSPLTQPGHWQNQEQQAQIFVSSSARSISRFSMSLELVTMKLIMQQN